ncbi:MAG: hypothetical protein DIKNOCCD_00300 [bacterium]|nr:hypothetical protein [bacterium]MCE7907037.1 hypothetical protein [Candidatus Omnitrophica bacterium COP1]
MLPKSKRGCYDDCEERQRENSVWLKKIMMSIHKHFILLAGLIGVFLLVPVPPCSAQKALDSLLEKVIPEEQAGDLNVYSLTDIQAVLGASLSWNALLRRAVLIEPEGGLSFSLVVGSPLGRCGPDIVEWPQAPILRNGEVYVSRGLLETVFSRYPNYKLPGQEEEPPAEPPLAEQGSEGEPEEPPPSSSGDLQIKSVMAILLPSQNAIASATGQSASPTARLVEELRRILEGNGIKLKSVSWNPKTPEKTYMDTDTLLAFRIESASPVMKSSFCYYDAPSPGAKGSELVEWNRVSQNYKRDSRAIADLMCRNFVSTFGDNRSIGLRGGPYQVLQGREAPGVLINLGISPSQSDEEIKKTAEIIGSSLAQIRKG